MSFTTYSIADYLSASGGGLSFWIILITTLAGMAGLVSLIGLVLIYAERKLAAHFQCRLGPMRVGWHGTLQSVADGIKLFLKEDIVPTGADPLVHILAPFMAILSTFLAVIIVPMSPTLQVIDLNVGVIYLSAVSGLGVLGILLAGWGSNNKWSLLGAMRAGAQIVSYEVTATLAILVGVLFSGSLKLSDIVLSQSQGWWIWRAPGVGLLGFLLLLVAITAETNRTPFDLAEGESELTAGFHTEYSGIRFAFFFLAEFVNMFIASGFLVTLFLGGWMPFHLGDLNEFNRLMDFIPPPLWFFGKTLFIIFLMMWFRWTFPRLRVDQLMKLEWKFLLPLGLINVTIAGILVVMGW